MKIKMPHRTIILTEEDKKLPQEERLAMVNSFLKEEIVLDGEKITIDDYLHFNFSNPSCIVIMEMLAYFTVKEYKKQEDIISRKGMQKMIKGNNKVTPFTSLSEEDKVAIGASDSPDYY